MIGSRISTALVAVCGLAVLAPPTAHAAPLRGAIVRHADGHVGGVFNPHVTAGVTAQGLPHLTWYGGAVMTHVKVYAVKWGAGSYASAINASSAPSIGDFLTKATNSSYLDTLSEYSTPGHTIGRGTYNGTTTIVPTHGNTGALDVTTAVEPDLAEQLGTALPSPDSNTLYMLFFPSSVTKITADGIDTSTNACGFHSTFVGNNKNVRYVVMPDLATSACANGSQDLLTAVASHELIESITDPSVGITDNGGWYDTHVPGGGAEIADICQLWGDPAGHVGGYAVAGGWSNQQQSCVTSGPVRTISVGNGSVVEGNSGVRYVKIPVTLSATSNVTVSVNVSFSGGTARGGSAPGPGVDYDNVGGTLLFSAPSGGRTVLTRVLSIPVSGDTAKEPNETFGVHLSSPSAPYALGRANGVGTIVNDD